MLYDLIPPDEMAKLFNEMAYEMLIAHKKGKTYVRVLEQMLMNPVAILGKDVRWTDAQEGRNEFIRMFFNAAHHHMNKKEKDSKPKNVKRTRKEVIANE